MQKSDEYKRVKIQSWKKEISFSNTRDISYITYKNLVNFHDIIAVTTLRHQTDNDVQSGIQNRNLTQVIPFISSISNNDDIKIAVGYQIHSANIAEIYINNCSQNEKILIHPDTDGLITNYRKIALCVFTADCLPVFLYAPTKNVIGLIHAGRKGTECGISEIAVQRMIKNYGCLPEDITALIGPSIGPCCYPVDLWEANKKQLQKCGLVNIINHEICTGCNTEYFYSYRKEKGIDGRIISILMMS